MICILTTFRQNFPLSGRELEGGRYIKAIDTNGKRVSLALSKLTGINYDSDFDLYEEESESEDYELLYEAQQWEELQYFCK